MRHLTTAPLSTLTLLLAALLALPACGDDADPDDSRTSTQALPAHCLELGAGQRLYDVVSQRTGWTVVTWLQQGPDAELEIATLDARGQLLDRLLVGLGAHTQPAALSAAFAGRTLVVTLDETLLLLDMDAPADVLEFPAPLRAADIATIDADRVALAGIADAQPPALTVAVFDVTRRMLTASRTFTEHVPALPTATPFRPQVRPVQLATDGDRIIAAWLRSGRDAIDAATFDLKARLDRSATLTEVEGDLLSMPRLAPFQPGELAMTWTTASGEVHLRTLPSDLNDVALDDLVLQDKGAANPTLAAFSDRLLVAWRDDSWALQARTLDRTSDGDLTLGELSLDPADGCVNQTWSPTLTPSANGALLLWLDEGWEPTGPRALYVVVSPVPPSP